MTVHDVTLIPGEVSNKPLIASVRRIVEAAGVSINWISPDIAPYQQPGWDETSWDRIVASVRQTRVALCGAMGIDMPSQVRSPHVELRERVGCYAGVRPVQSLRGLKCQVKNLDMVVIRETTEDVYAGHEHEVMPGGVVTLKVVTEPASRRIAEFAFDYARRHKRKRISIIHKANIMKLTDGLFMNTCLAVAANYPDIEVETLIVDNASMQMVLRPERYDVVLCGNLYGDIMSAIAAGLAGGQSAVLQGVAIADDAVIFESLISHKETPSEDSSPLPLLLPAIRLVRHLGDEAAGDRIWNVMQDVLEDGTVLTPDLGGTASGCEMTDAIVRRF